MDRHAFELLSKNTSQSRERWIWRIITAVHISGTLSLALARYVERFGGGSASPIQLLAYWGLATLCVCPVATLIATANWHSTWRVMAALSISVGLAMAQVFALLPLIQ